MRRTAFLAAMCVLGAVTSARAESRSVRIDYEAAHACPDERRFVELTRDRIRPWATIDEHGELVARVRAEPEEGGFAGRLSLEDTAGTSLGVRAIQDADCEEVVLALALFLAVALEAEAANPHAAPSTRPEAPPGPSLEVTPPPARPRADARAPRPPPPAQKASAIDWRLVARAQGVTGRMPDAALGGAIALELGPRHRSSMLRPYGSLGIDAVPYSERREGRGQLELGWGAVFGRVCAGFDVSGRSDGAVGGWLEPWACGRAEAGGLQAASRGYAVNRTELLPWYAAGLEAGLAVRLSQLFSLGVFANAMAPIVRHELVLGDVRVFRAPIVTAEAGLELKVRIW
ncbi:MAG: hypothetical protein KF850_34880 [Labilithrix sp.]|nr:hypothetical protein [Labilithrix sp.]